MPGDKLRAYAARVRDRLQRSLSALNAYRAKLASVKKSAADSLQARREAEEAKFALSKQLELMTEHFSMLQARLVSVVSYAKAQGIEIPHAVLNG